MADEQLIQKQIGKQKIIKNKKNIAHAPVIKKINEKEKQGIKMGEKKETKKPEKSEEKKIEETKSKKEIRVKKTEAKIYGRNLRISLKHAVAIGKFIKNKKIDQAISDLQLVMRKKLAVPMKGELAHRKGKGMMSGKYPVRASKEFIKLLKSLNANSIVNGMALEKTIISEVIANKAPNRLHRFGSTKFKQTHVIIKAKEIKSKEV